MGQSGEKEREWANSQTGPFWQLTVACRQEQTLILISALLFTGSVAFRKWWNPVQTLFSLTIRHPLSLQVALRPGSVYIKPLSWSLVHKGKKRVFSSVELFDDHLTQTVLSPFYVWVKLNHRSYTQALRASPFALECSVLAFSLFSGPVHALRTHVANASLLAVGVAKGTYQTLLGTGWV